MDMMGKMICWSDYVLCPRRPDYLVGALCRASSSLLGARVQVMDRGIQTPYIGSQKQKWPENINR
jgi:hypothetical protein